MSVHKKVTCYEDDETPRRIKTTDSYRLILNY